MRIPRTILLKWNWAYYRNLISISILCLRSNSWRESLQSRRPRPRRGTWHNSSSKFSFLITKVSPSSRHTLPWVHFIYPIACCWTGAPISNKYSSIIRPTKRKACKSNQKSWCCRFKTTRSQISIFKDWSKSLHPSSSPRWARLTSPWMSRLAASREAKGKAHRSKRYLSRGIQPTRKWPQQTKSVPSPATKCSLTTRLRKASLPVATPAQRRRVRTSNSIRGRIAIRFWTRTLASIRRGTTLRKRSRRIQKQRYPAFRRNARLRSLCAIPRTQIERVHCTRRGRAYR